MSLDTYIKSGKSVSCLTIEDVIVTLDLIGKYRPGMFSNTPAKKLLDYPKDGRVLILSITGWSDTADLIYPTAYSLSIQLGV